MLHALAIGFGVTVGVTLGLFVCLVVVAALDVIVNGPKR